MHRRNRHLNAAAAGAVCVLDTRYLSGLSNGNGISSWTSRTSTNSPTQGTAVNQPVYTTNVLNGNPGALFNNAASSQGRWLNFSSGMTTGATALSAIYFYKRTGISSAPGAILANFSTNVGYHNHEPWTDSNIYTSFGRVGAGGYQDPSGRVSFLLTTAVPNDQNTITYIQGATNNWKFIANNSTVYSTTSNIFSNAGANAKLGGSGGCNDSGCDGVYYFWTGYIYSVMIFKAVLSDSLRKRFQQSIGFSFKFAI